MQALLTYKSALLQTIETLVFLPNLLLVDGHTQSQKLLITLFDEFYEHPVCCDILTDTVNL